MVIGWLSRDIVVWGWDWLEFCFREGVWWVVGV